MFLVKGGCSVGALEKDSFHFIWILFQVHQGLEILMLDLGYVVYQKIYGNKIYLSKRKTKKHSCNCSLHIFTCLPILKIKSEDKKNVSSHRFGFNQVQREFNQIGFYLCQIEMGSFRLIEIGSLLVWAFLFAVMLKKNIYFYFEPAKCLMKCLGEKRPLQRKRNGLPTIEELLLIVLSCHIFDNPKLLSLPLYTLNSIVLPCNISAIGYGDCSRMHNCIVQMACLIAQNI